MTSAQGLSGSAPLPGQAIRRAAVEARGRAYAPYSKFTVGAAVLASDGILHTGANIENASYGLTICAERVAMATAIMSGRSSFLAIAVASPGAVAPCGACRQFLVEFSPQAEVILIDAIDPDRFRTVRLADLLPEYFSGASLPHGSLD